MQISIDRDRYEVLASDIPITKAQTEVYDLLLNLGEAGRQNVDSASLVRHFQFKSILPLTARLDHLVERGHLRLLTD